MRAILAAAALVCTACVMVKNDASGAPGAPRCDAAPAQSLVGQPATPELAERARRRSGAEIVRWLRPGQIVTMEYRYGRLNISVDSRNRVERITCG